MLEPTIRLTQSQIDFFAREGFLALDALTTPEDVAILRESYDRIFAQKAGREVGDQFDLGGTDEEGREAVLPQILNPSKYAPELNDSLLLVNATAVAKQLLGDEANCSFAHAIYKPARTGAQTPWHQDASYWNPEYRYRSVSIWVPLQEATEANGCMHFVPRSHELDVVDHQSINNDPRIHGLELAPHERWRVKDPVACPLPPGGATFHGGSMFHHTPANRSDIPRRAIILNGGVPAAKRDQPRQFPWLQQKKTPRQARLEEAQKSGKKIAPPPTGNVKKTGAAALG